MSPQAVNWLIVLAYFAVTVWVGGRLGRGQRNLDDYFLAGRRIPWWTACLSIVATETSTLTFVGVPGIAYGGSLVFLQVALGYIVGRFAVAALLVPAYFEGRVQTAYELLQHRFGGPVQSLASAVFLISRCLADGVRLFATALVLMELLSMRLEVAISLITVITLYYTLRGGLRAVIWNDAIQLIVYVGGAGLAAAMLISRIDGGLGGAFTALADAGKLTIVDPTWDWGIPYTVWAGVLGGVVLTAATHGTDQMFVQRLLACRSRREAQLAVIGSGILVFAQMALFLGIGALLWAFYQQGSPEVVFASNDQVFPRFIAKEMPYVGGIVIAAVFAAAMSTLSSSLSSLASASTFDFLLRWRARGSVDGATEAGALRTSRWVTCAWAVALAAVAFVAQASGSVLEVGLTITSITFGGVLGIFLVGLTSWKVPATRAAIAMAAGLIVLIAVHIVGGLAWTWYTGLGAGVTVIVAAVLRERG